MKKIKKMAFSGVLTALCTVFLFIGSLFDSLDLSSAAMGSLVVLIAMIELGKSWAFGVYTASSILSLILLPNKTAALIFFLFAGFYPIIKEPFNKIKPILLSYLVRILFFNCALTLLLYVLSLFGLVFDEMVGIEILIYIVSNVTFIVYDFALERVAVTYVVRIKRILFRKR